MNAFTRILVESHKETLENLDAILKENGPHYTIGWLTSALKSAVSEIERLAAEQAR